MKTRLAIYVAVVLALIGIGLGISGALDDDEGRKAATAPPVAGRDRSSAPVPDGGPDAGGAVPDAGRVASTVRVVGIEGRAERRPEGLEEWEEIASGDVLAVDDSVRTARDAGVTLGLGADSTVSLGGGTQVQVREVSDSVQRFGLVRGRVSVRYQEDGVRVLRVENEDGSAVAEARDGAFTVLGEGGTVAVAATEGSVDLEAAGRRVTVAAGQQSVTLRGEAPTRPQAIPLDLLLKVTDPGCRVQREASIVIRGRTSPGALVRVNDIPGEADVQGRFAVRVPLTVGRNTIVVVTEDAAGRVKRRTFPCVTVDPRAPIEKIDIQWGAPAGGGR